MNEENPVVRQVANIVTTLAFFALVGFLALHHSLSEQSIAWILGAFTVGTSGVKLTKHVTTGVSQSAMRAVRPSWRDPPSDGGGGSGGGGTERAPERERERGKGPGGIIRRLIVDWGPTVLAGSLAAMILVLSREPVAIAAPVDPAALLRR